MKLTENFSLAELTKSQTATRLGFDNKPNQNQVLALTKLCENVLQRIRNNFEMPVFISSGFRSARLSEAIGSSSKSQHCKGQAIDIDDTFGRCTNAEMYHFIKGGLISSVRRRTANGNESMSTS